MLYTKTLDQILHEDWIDQYLEETPLEIEPRLVDLLREYEALIQYQDRIFHDKVYLKRANH